MKSMMPREKIEATTLNLMAGALTAELLRQLQRSEPNWFMMILIFMHLAKTSQTENYFVGRQATCPYISHPLRGISFFMRLLYFSRHMSEFTSLKMII